MTPRDEPEDHLRWLRAMSQGDQDALAQLQRAFYARLWRYLWVQLHGNTPWIEEVLQDIFLAVWRASPTFRGEAHFVAAWIFQIAHHHAANARRSFARHIADHTSVSWDTVEAPIVSFEHATVQRLALAEAIGQLSAKHQEVLYLVFFQGFAPEEVAHILRIPGGTVKSRLSYARRALSQALDTPFLAEVPPHDA